MNTSAPIHPNSAVFRFYAELNDLAAGPGTLEHVYQFSGHPTVEESLAAQGVPRDEVEVILVNGEAAGFDQLLYDGDRVSVYPAFESFDVGPVLRVRDEPLRQCRFVCDVHVGRLARWLRLLGFDTVYLNQPHGERLVDLAVREHRALLTRDGRLLAHPQLTHAHLIQSETPAEQLIDVVERFQLQPAVMPFSRCLECNGRLLPVTKEEVLPELEPRTREVFDEFFRCESCHRVYWRGSHYDRMIARLKDLFGPAFMKPTR